MINNLMEEDDILIDEENIPELGQWATFAEEEIEGEAKPPADYVLRYAYILHQNNMSEDGDIQQISSALKRFMQNRLYYDVQVGVHTRRVLPRYRAAIDDDMPVMIKMGERFMTGVGYWSDDGNDYIIVHDPLSSEIGIDIFNDDALPLDHVGESEGEIIPGCQFILVGDATEDMELLIIEKWEFDFSDLLDMLELE